MTDAEQLQMVADQYNSLNDRFFDLMDRCKTPQQRSDLGTVLMDAHANLIHTQRLFFENNSMAVQTIGKAAEQAQISIDKSLADLEDIAKSLDAITAAVKIVTQVAAVFVQI